MCGICSRNVRDNPNYNLILFHILQSNILERIWYQSSFTFHFNEYSARLNFVIAGAFLLTQLKRIIYIYIYSQ